MTLNHNYFSNKISRKNLLYLLRLLMCLALLVYVLLSYDTASVFQHLGKTDLRWLAAACATAYLGIFCSALKWKSILKAYGVQATATHLFSLYLESGFFNLFFPGFVAGDVSRIARTSVDGKPSLEATLAVFLERFSGLLISCIYIIVIGMMGGYSSLNQIWFKAVLFAIGMTLVGLLVLLNFRRFSGLVRFLPRFMKPIILQTADKLHCALRKATSNGVLLLQLAILSSLFIVLMVLTSYFIAHSISFHIPFKALLAYIPLTALLINLPISIAGIGIRENLFVLFFSTFGFSPAEIIAFGLVRSGLALLEKLSGGLLLSLRALRPSVGIKKWLSPQKSDRFV